MSKLEENGHSRIYTYINLNGSFDHRGYSDDDFPDNPSSLKFHLKVFTSSVDFRPKSPSECYCVLVKPICFTSTQIRLIQSK